MTFTLHPNLQSKVFVCSLPLCEILLENNFYYPWIFLVPRVENVSKILDLSKNEQAQLFLELEIAQKIIWDTFKPDQLNVAAIGNKTPQLHIHVIGRYVNDPAWPSTVWDHDSKICYPNEVLQERTAFLKIKFEENMACL